MLVCVAVSRCASGRATAMVLPVKTGYSDAGVGRNRFSGRVTSSAVYETFFSTPALGYQCGERAYFTSVRIHALVVPTTTLGSAGVSAVIIIWLGA